MGKDGIVFGHVLSARNSWDIAIWQLKRDLELWSKVWPETDFMGGNCLQKNG